MLCRKVRQSHEARCHRPGICVAKPFSKCTLTVVVAVLALQKAVSESGGEAQMPLVVWSGSAVTVFGKALVRGEERQWAAIHCSQCQSVVEHRTFCAQETYHFWLLLASSAAVKGFDEEDANRWSAPFENTCTLHEATILVC